MYSPLHDTVQSREWLFAVCLAFKYRLSFVGSFSPSGRDKQGKGIHYSCWLKSDFEPKAVHGWIIVGTHRLSNCFANDMLCNHRCWLIGCDFPSSLFSSLRASRSSLFSVLSDDLTTDGPLEFYGPCHSLEFRASARWRWRLSLKKPNLSIHQSNDPSLLFYFVAFFLQNLTINCFCFHIVSM